MIAVRAAEGHPLLLSTSRHVTQGMIDVSASTGTPRTSRSARFPAKADRGGDPYELRVAGLSDGGRWHPQSATVSTADTAAHVTIALDKATSDLLRIRIAAPMSRTVKWKIRFTRQPAKARPAPRPASPH